MLINKVNFYLNKKYNHHNHIIVRIEINKYSLKNNSLLILDNNSFNKDKEITKIIKNYLRTIYFSRTIFHLMEKVNIIIR